MATLTPLTLLEAQTLGSLFGLDVASVVGLEAGSVNSNYKLELGPRLGVRADKPRYPPNPGPRLGVRADTPRYPPDPHGQRVFLRIYEEQRTPGALREAQMLEHLAAHGVRTPRPLERTDGTLLAEHRGKPVVVFPWIEGESLCQRDVTNDRMQRVGEALARVHIAGESFEGAPADRFDRGALTARLEGLPWSNLPADVRDDATELLRRLKEAPPRAPASLGVIHGDLFRDNVLWKGSEIGGLLDFESASRGSAAFDLSVTILAWCFGDDLELELMRAFARGYASVRPLTPEDREHLFNEAKFAALRFAVTRITDFEMRPRGTGFYRDYRRFLGRSRALDRLGPEGLLTLFAA